MSTGNQESTEVLLMQAGAWQRASREGFLEEASRWSLERQGWGASEQAKGIAWPKAKRPENPEGLFREFAEG